VAAGFTWAVTDAVTLHLAIAVENSSSIIPNIWLTTPRFGVGGVQRVALRRVPIVQVRVTDNVFLDFTAEWYQHPLGLHRAEALAGVTVEL
jgi:hypothetical protein